VGREIERDRRHGRRRVRPEARQRPQTFFRVRKNAAALVRAKDETEAEAPLSTLRQACAHASAEACCALGDAYRDGKGMPANPEKASTFRAKACDLGLGRCCSP